MAGGRIKGITIEIGGDTTKLDKALKGVDSNLWTIQKDLKAVEQLLKIDPSNTELLAQKQRLLAEAVAASSERFDTLSKAAKAAGQELAAGKIDTQQYKNLNLELDLEAAKLKEAERALADFNAGLDDTQSAAKGATGGIKKVGDAADDAAGGFGGLKQFSAGASSALGLSDIAAAGAAFTIGQKLVEALVECVKWLWSFDDATEELREEMGKLNTAFENAGYKIEAAKRVYQDFFNILGDTGTATEASQLLANMSSKEEELEKTTAILSRRYGGFAKNIPIDKLVEAARETAKTGEVTGILAETLEDSGVSAADLESRLAEINERLNSGATEIIRAGDSADKAKGKVGTLAETMNALGVALMGWTPEAEQVSDSLYQMAQQEEGLARWTEIAAGVYGTFGDSLPIEGLIEAANETAKTGKVTGVLADALNWAGISEDDFNKTLGENIDVGNRTALIMDTLTNTYKDAADAFYKNNEAIIKNREAQSALNDKSAELGQSVADVKAAIDEAFGPATELLLTVATGAFETILGPIKAIDDAIQGLIDGIRDAINWLRKLAGQESIWDEHWNLVTPGKHPVENWFPDAGRSFSAVTAEDLPHLAQGTVTRPNSPFVAVVGDNPQEPEVIAPYSAIKRAARDAMTEAGAARGGAQAITINFTGDLAQLARVLHPYITSEGQRLGPNLVT